MFENRAQSAHLHSGHAAVVVEDVFGDMHRKLLQKEGRDVEPIVCDARKGAVIDRGGLLKAHGERVGGGAASGGDVGAEWGPRDNRRGCCGRRIACAYSRQPADDVDNVLRRIVVVSKAGTHACTRAWLPQPQTKRTHRPVNATVNAHRAHRGVGGVQSRWERESSHVHDLDAAR